ncbi:thiolase family protein [Coraliomargarita parva]|uniref:thiolase family protein n=1 Tax=Coraliomargarita parva TaxID=3014050 RepID=UPI0022B4815A|nr:thiolase family protein [Coraliomargarita parva]
MNTVLYVIAGIRTPFCRMGTELASLSASDLGRAAVTALLDQTGIDPARVSELIFGCVGQPADSANIARVIALRSGLPRTVPAMTVNRNCASGMESLTTACQRLQAERGDCYIVGGVESMSHYPLLFRDSALEHFTGLSKAHSLAERLKALSRFRPNDFSPLLGLQLGLTDPVSGMNMGETAELLVREYDISRECQDRFAVASHRKAKAHREATAREIAPVFVDGHAVLADNGIREDCNEQGLAGLKPVFDRETGSVTPGNASQITDGAVALLVGSETCARELGIEPLGRLIDYAYTGCDPARMGLGPVRAIEAVNRRAGLKLADADLYEINEAFAAQVLAVLKALMEPEYSARAGLPAPLGEIPLDRLNQRGGAIALGHPVGATGARLILTALQQLKDSGGRRALVSLCIGGGQGAALWLESTHPKSK